MDSKAGMESLLEVWNMQSSFSKMEEVIHKDTGENNAR